MLNSGAGLNCSSGDKENRSFAGNTPEDVIQQLKGFTNKGAGTGDFTLIAYDQIRIGDYTWRPQNKDFIKVSMKGIYFVMPHAVNVNQMVDLGIPHDAVLNTVFHASPRLPCILLQTDPKYAAWISKALGLNSDSADGNYYSPVDGANCQKHIAIQNISNANTVTYGIFRKIFKSTINEPDFTQANEMVVNFKCHGHGVNSGTTMSQASIPRSVASEPLPPTSQNGLGSPMEVGRPMKLKDFVAVCPVCSLKCANLWRCERCHTEFSADVQLLNSTDLRDNFLPNYIKKEEDDSFPEFENKNADSSEPLICLDDSDVSSKLSVKPSVEDLNINSVQDSEKKPSPNLKRSESHHIERAEKRIRILPGASRKTLDELHKLNPVHRKPYCTNKSKVDSVVRNSDTVVEETLFNSRSRILRLIQVDLQGIKSLFDEHGYKESVEKIIFATLCSMEVLENVLYSLKAASCVEFRHDSLIANEDKPGKWEIERLKNKNMRIFEVTFDRKEYMDLSEGEKTNTRARIIGILMLASKCYPNLDECNIYVPLHGEIERALDTLVPKFGSRGLKKVNYEKLVIQYTVHKARISTRNSKNVDVGAGKPGKDTAAVKTIPDLSSASLKKLGNKRNSAELICLSSDDDEEPEPKIAVQDNNCTQSSSISSSQQSDLPPEQLIESLIKKFGDECPQDPGAFTHFQFTSARVGDYKCVSALNKLRVYKNGLVFSIPHSAQVARMVQVGIPEEVVTNITIVAKFQTCMPCIIVQTSILFENWIEKALGLSPTKTNSGNGGKRTKSIIFLDCTIKSSYSLDLFKRIFASKIREVDYTVAQDMIANSNILSY